MVARPAECQCRTSRMLSYDMQIDSKASTRDSFYELNGVRTARSCEFACIVMHAPAQ